MKNVLALLVTCGLLLAAPATAATPTLRGSVGPGGHDPARGEAEEGRRLPRQWRTSRTTTTSTSEAPGSTSPRGSAPPARGRSASSCSPARRTARLRPARGRDARFVHRAALSGTSGREPRADDQAPAHRPHSRSREAATLDRRGPSPRARRLQARRADRDDGRRGRGQTGRAVAWRRETAPRSRSQPFSTGSSCRAGRGRSGAGRCSRGSAGSSSTSARPSSRRRRALRARDLRRDRGHDAAALARRVECECGLFSGIDARNARRRTTRTRPVLRLTGMAVFSRDRRQRQGRRGRRAVGSASVGRARRELLPERHPTADRGTRRDRRAIRRRALSFRAFRRGAPSR